MSQNAALPAAVAMPTPDGPPLTSLVTSVDSMWPESARMPRPLACANSRMIDQTLIGQQLLQRAGAAAESQRIDRQHRDIRGNVISAIAGRLILAGERFAHDHPQRVAGRRAMAGRQHEFVAVGMFGPPVVVAQAALSRARPDA